MGAFNTFAYSKKYFVSQEIEFIPESEIDPEFGESYKEPLDLINLLSDNIIVLDIGAFGNKVAIGTTDITSPRQELDVFGTAIVSERVGIGIITPRQELDVFGTAIVSERVGIGSTEPQQRVDVAWSIKIDENIYDSVNVPGRNGYQLSRDVGGIRWIPLISQGASSGVGFGTIVGIPTYSEGIFILDEGVPLYPES